MKDARFSDHQRRLTTKSLAWTLRLERFAFNEIPTLGSGEFFFQSPITVLCGPNGVGKTTLLRAIWAALNSGLLDQSVSSKVLTSGNATISLIEKGKSISSEIDFAKAVRFASSNPFEAGHFVDSAMSSKSYQDEFGAFNSVEDIVNGSSGVELSQKAVQEINFILNRDYRVIRLYEVEMGNLVPFFEVAHGDDRYDSRTMGSGEIAALHLWWKISTLVSGELVLLEEPEAFLSHACQVNFAKHLIAKAVEERFAVVARLRTHSCHSQKMTIAAMTMADMKV